MSVQLLHRARISAFVFVLALAALGLLKQGLIPANAASARADTISVNPGESIQAAIDAATAGDTILINAGIYTESLTLGKPVSLTGVSRVTTRIHGVANQSVLTVSGNTISNSVIISGLTFANGGGFIVTLGGGIVVQDGARPLIQHVTIDNNTATYMGKGGGIGSFSSLTLVDVEFLNNTADDGGGLYIYGDAILTDCIFINNLATSGSSVSGGGGIYAEGDLLIFSTDFISNSTAHAGGGIYAAGEVNIIGGHFIKNRNTSPLASGGGVSAHGVTISGTRFLSNTSMLMGGAIASSQVTVIDGHFEDNLAFQDGGAIFVGSALQMTNTEVSNNSAGGNGCGVYNNGGTTLVTGGRFVGNRCWNSDTTAGIGGGLFTWDVLVLSGTQFISNTARQGGGLYARGPAIMMDSRFERNRSTGILFSSGGGMVAGGSLSMTGTQFISNTAVFDGGGLYFYASGDARIVNSLFAHNTTNSDGAGLFLYSTDGRIDLLHTTIADQALNPKQGIFVQHGLLGITNTLITNHAIGIERWAGATVYEDYNLLLGNTKNFSGTINSGAHHPTGDPKFVDPAKGDYHLSPGSAAIDAGANVGVSTDIDGEMRPNGAAPDLGADEYWPSTLPVAIADLRMTSVVTDSTSLTTTLRWTAPLNAVTYTLRYSSSLIGAGSWNSALDITVPFTASIPGAFESVDAVVPYSGGTVYLALKSQNGAGVYSGLSNNAFWPHHDVFLPLTMK
jgi:predicted outer membrane repeat protein